MSIQLPSSITIDYNPPAIYERVKDKWNIDWKKGSIVMVYGNTIHQSFKHPMETDLMVHELVHVRQHREYPGGPAAWWERYISDVDFRISQELEAYRTQYLWAQDNYTSKYCKVVLKHCAKSLASNLYGNVMTEEEAFVAIADPGNLL